MAPNVTTRAKNPCSTVVINENNKRPGGWTEQEDAALAALVTKLGRKNWQQLAQHIPGRCAKSCRLRWCNQLDPSLKKDKFSEWEEAVILQGQYELGNKWASIAKLLPGRSDNAIKNHFNTTLKRKMRTRSLNNKYLQPHRTSLQALLSMGPPQAKKARISGPVSSAADDQENNPRLAGSPATSSTHHQPANGYSSMAPASQGTGRPSLISGDHASDVQTSDSKKLPSSCSFSSLPSPASPGTSSTSSPALLHIHPEHCAPAPTHPGDAHPHAQDLHPHMRFPSPRHPHEPPPHPSSRFPFPMPQSACPSPNPADPTARMHPHRRYLVARRHTAPDGLIGSPLGHPSSSLEPSPMLIDNPRYPAHLPHRLASQSLPSSTPSHLGPQQQQQQGHPTQHHSYPSAGPIPRTNSMPAEGLHHHLSHLQTPAPEAPFRRPSAPNSLNSRLSPFSLPTAQLPISLPFSTPASSRPQSYQPPSATPTPQSSAPSFNPSAGMRSSTPTSLLPNAPQSIPSSAPAPHHELSYPPTQHQAPRTFFNSLPPSATPTSLRPLNSAPPSMARHHTLSPFTTSDALPPVVPRRHTYPQLPLSHLPPRTTTPLPPSNLPSRPLAPSNQLLPPQHRPLHPQPSDSEAAAQLYSAWSQAPADASAAPGPTGPLPSSSSSGNSQMTTAPSQQLPSTSSWNPQYSSQHAPPQQLTTSRQLGAGQTVLVPSNGGQVVLVGPGSTTLPAATSPQDPQQRMLGQLHNDARPPMAGLDSHRLSLGGPLISQASPAPPTSSHPQPFSNSSNIFSNPRPTSAYLPRSSTPAPASLLPPTTAGPPLPHPLPNNNNNYMPSPAAPHSQPAHMSITSYSNTHPFQSSGPPSHLSAPHTTNRFPQACTAPPTQQYGHSIKAEAPAPRAPTPSLQSVLSGSLLPPSAHHPQHMLASYNSSEVLPPGGLPMSPLPELDPLQPNLAGDLDLDLPDWLPMPDWTTEAVA